MKALTVKHGMLPGSHEWPRKPECRCGEDWDRWIGRCAADVPVVES